MRAPHVLFLTEKWCDCDPAKGPTNSAHNLFGSLDSTGLATQTHFHFDEYVRATEVRGDQVLIECCVREKPSLIVWTFAFSGPDIFNPQPETMAYISRKLGIPIVALWFDSIWPGVVETAERYVAHVLLNVILDSSSYYPSRTRSPGKYLPFWTPQDPTLFYADSSVRDIEVSFVGSLGRYPDRQAGMAALSAAGIPFVQTGGQREHAVSAEEYAAILRRSRISLNFCGANGTDVQLKGRVFEILHSGAMLMESANPETARWLQPMVEYVPFDDPADMVDKIRYYRAHPAEREAIAAAGLRAALTRFSASVFWKTILDEAARRKLAVDFVRKLSA